MLSCYISSLLAITLCGCASPGVPRPPSLRLPATVTDLTAMRAGDRVSLQWTAPSRTTDNVDLTGPTTVEICRDPATVPSSTLQPARCTPVMTLAGHPGVSTATDQLASPWTSATSTSLIAYRVRTLNTAGRSGPSSAVALVPAGPSLPPIAGFQARQTKAGVVLEWSKTTANSGSAAPEATVEVLRTAQTPDSKSPETPASAPPGATQSNRSLSDPFSRTRSSKQSVEMRLQQGSATTSIRPGQQKPTELDGMIDRGATQGMVYQYSAQRVQAISTDGKMTELRSEPTAPTTITMRDTFPPAPPRGLVSVPGTATGQHGRIGTIDLAWEPNTETDLAGYFVYRTDLADAASATAKPLQLNPSPLPASTYRDESALPGHRYIYRVSAVDRNGNVSTLSLAVEDEPEVR